FKVKIEKFSIGFGKELYGWTKNGTRYCFSLIPFGGFVKMKGESIFENNLAETDDIGSFAILKNWKKILIVISGPFMNIIFAFFILVILTAFTGIKYFDLENPNIGKILENSPAQIAGLKSNDQILKINDENVYNWNDYTEKFDNIVSNENQENITLTIRRLNHPQVLEEKTIRIIPEYNNEFKRKMIGISPILKNKKIGIFKNLYFTTLTLFKISRHFYKLFDFSKYFNSNKQEKNDTISFNNIIGPIGILFEIQKAFTDNLEAFAHIIALISLNLGLVNLLPLPILDGGYILIFFTEFIIRKKINRKFLYAIFNIMILFLILFMIFITLRDLLSRVS
ncbi:MAG: M50 family metallopeptidase, partial [Elusimicrobiota bacterium]|nr:M50 family metallopeptidase [Elusimicrobiota bacterium]